MSRVGKHPIPLPDGVSVEIDGRDVSVSGPKGTLRQRLPASVKVAVDGSAIRVTPHSESEESRADWGLARAITANMVTGVDKGFTRHLDMEGVGYRAAVNDRLLTLELGFSHPIHVAVPEDITIRCARQTEIEISGADVQRVGQIAAEIRAFRKPEPYKGKGIRYRGEVIRRKEGKKK